MPGINPETYLTDVLTCIDDQGVSRIDELTPRHWAKSKNTPADLSAGIPQRQPIRSSPTTLCKLKAYTKTLFEPRLATPQTEIHLPLPGLVQPGAHLPTQVPGDFGMLRQKTPEFVGIFFHIE